MPQMTQRPRWVRSKLWGHCVYLRLFSCVRLLETLWTLALQAPPSVGFSRWEYWSGLHSLPQRTFLTQGSSLTSPAWQVGPLPWATLAGSPPAFINWYLPLHLGTALGASPAGTLRRTKAPSTLKSSPFRFRALMLFVVLTSENGTFLFIHVNLHDMLLKSLPIKISKLWGLPSFFVTHTGTWIPVASIIPSPLAGNSIRVTVHHISNNALHLTATEMLQHKNQQSFCQLVLSSIIDQNFGWHQRRIPHGTTSTQHHGPEL